MRISLKSLRGKLFLYVTSILLVVIAFGVYLLVETMQAKNESEEIQTRRFPAELTIARLLSDINYQAAAAEERIRQKDTLSWHKAEALWDAEMKPDLEILKESREMFPVDDQRNIDSLTFLLESYQETVQQINDWIIRNYLEASTDSAFLAELPSRYQLELLPQVDNVNKIKDRAQEYLESLRENNAKLIKENIASIRQQTSVSTWTSVAFVMVVGSILLVGGYMIHASITESLKGPGEVLEYLVKGDTSKNAETQTAEMKNITEAANRLSANLQQASNFTQSIGEGKFDFDFKPASENDVLGNSLVQMRDKLKSIADTDRKRNWVTEGLAKFADIMRRNENYEELSNTVIAELVRYTKANQGGMFILNKDNENDPHLQLTACYAFERRKYMQKRVKLGEGLVGQCVLEGRSIYLIDIPQNYVTITSGLGSANPSCLLVVPLKVNDVIEGVIELASFKKFDKHEIEFVEKVGEIIASTVSNARINDRTRKLLEESQQQSEEMRAQEEEMRQNMEEMQATQEQMQRQTEELKKMQGKLEMEKSMFQVLMEYLSDRITYKDTESRIIRVNKAKAIKFNMPADEMIGKTDFDFFNKEHAEKARRDEQHLMESGVPTLDAEERMVFNQTGEVWWTSTSRVPFKNDHGETIGVFIIAKDISKIKIAESSLKDREKIIERLLDNMPVIRYTIGRDGKLSDVWKAKGVVGFDPSTWKSRNVKDVLPEVFDLIHQEGLEGSDLVCKGMVEMNGEKEVFKHYLFKDSAYEGVYLAFALKQ